ncbi:MAG: class I SAM-dependent methyltransferase [Ornithinibacter sp.]
MLDAGRGDAAARGLELAWEEGDAEALPYPDGHFDVVLSCVGVMFAPHHQTAADEIVRVARPGGTMALINWTPEGFIGQMLAVMKPYTPAPPPSASPPAMWGSSDHVQERFGTAMGGLTSAREHAHVAGFDSGAQLRDFLKANYGPTIMVFAALADQPHRAAELDGALAELGDRYLRDGQMEWEYLLTTATRS